MQPTRTTTRCIAAPSSARKGQAHCSCRCDYRCHEHPTLGHPVVGHDDQRLVGTTRGSRRRKCLAFRVSRVGSGGAAAVSTPLDNIKTQLQLGHHKSAALAMAAITKERGLIGGFFKGVVPRVCHMAPSAAITLTTYEAMKTLLA